MIVYVFGSREVTDRHLVFETLSRLAPLTTVSAYLNSRQACSPDELWSGAARGADTLAAAWARHFNIKLREWPADWARHGRKAGALRNSELINALPAGSLCIGFAPPWCRRRERMSPGSADAIRKCLARGLRTILVFSNGVNLQLGATPSDDTVKAITAGGSF